jgi:polygalacturonase
VLLVVAGCLAWAQPNATQPAGTAAHDKLSITTTGVISSGADPAGFFGAGPNLGGQDYTMTILLDSLGSSYFAGKSGTFASDIADPIKGSVTVTVNGRAMKSALVNATSATLVEDQYHFYAANSGLDTPANFASASQDIQCATACVPYANLRTAFSYTLQSEDAGLDTFTFTSADGAAMVTFTGAPVNIAVESSRGKKIPPKPAMASSSNPCDPRYYGAIDDGAIGTNAGTDNTAAIQSAIDACAASGGGIVPLRLAGGTGVYRTGPIMLASHVLLDVNAGVTLLGTTDHSRYSIAYLNYPMPGTGVDPPQPTKPYEALVVAYNAVDTGIIGTGTINGQGNVTAADGGPSWWTLPPPAIGVTVNGTTWYREPYTDIPTSNGTPRPWLVEFYKCRRVAVSGITLVDSPMWTLVFRYSRRITVANYHVRNYLDGLLRMPSAVGPNTDGIDLVGASHVNIANMTASVGDDDIAIKSGLPLNVVNGVAVDSDPNEIGLPSLATHDVRIGNSMFTGGSGISVGSEAANGVYNLTVENIQSVGPTNTGFRIKTGRTRGSYRTGDYNITVRNMKLTNVAQPIVLNAYYPASTGPVETIGNPSTYDNPQPITAITPNVHDVTISGLTATGATSTSLIVGVPESCILNVSLDNVNITTSNAAAGFQLRNMTGTFTNVNVTNTRTGAPAYAVQENVDISSMASPGLPTQVTPPLATAPAGAPCGRNAPGGSVP